MAPLFVSKAKREGAASWRKWACAAAGTRHDILLFPGKFRKRGVE